MHKLDWRRIGGNIVFMLPFALLIQWFNNLCDAFLPQSNTFFSNTCYICLNFFGVFLIGVAISIYQRVNIVLHAQDDLFQIIRFRYTKGNATNSHGHFGLDAYWSNWQHRYWYDLRFYFPRVFYRLGWPARFSKIEASSFRRWQINSTRSSSWA